jgi:hypothetical protein
MKTLNIALLLVLVWAGLPARADESATGVIGKVEKLYVRQSNNFFIEKSLVRKPSSSEQWTEVRFAAPLADGRKSEIVRLPESAVVEPGDLVSTQLVAQRERVRGLIPDVNRMVAVVAKHDTLAAMAFDLPAPSPAAVMPFVQALQSTRP